MDEKICKYCLEEEENFNNPIINPCDCTNGVHLNCLAIWFTYSEQTDVPRSCEICQGEYIGIEVHHQTGFCSPPPPPPPPPPPLHLTPPSPPATRYQPFFHQPPPPPERRATTVVHPAPTAMIERRQTIIRPNNILCYRCGKKELICYTSSSFFGLSSIMMIVSDLGMVPYDLSLYSLCFIGVFCLSILTSTILTGKRVRNIEYYLRRQRWNRIYVSTTN